MDLKVDTRLTHFVGDHDLQQFLTHHAGTLIEITGASNDTDKSCDVNGKFTSQEVADSKWKEVKDSGSVDVHELGKVLHHFMYAGLILPGRYIVQFSW